MAPLIPENNFTYNSTNVSEVSKKTKKIQRKYWSVMVAVSP